MTRPYETAHALRDTLISPNESDANLEFANVVDGLFAVARAIRWAARVYAFVHGAGACPADLNAP